MTTSGKKNYQAWDVKTTDFPAHGSRADQLTFLLRYAILAPSSHNSQPWRFTITEKSILIHPEERRMLPVADPKNRLLLIAHGCVLTYLRIAGAYFGFSTETDYFPQVKTSSRITFYQNHYHSYRSSRHIHAITQRYSDRTKYHNDTLDHNFMQWLQEQSTNEVRVDAVTTRQQKKQIANFLIKFRSNTFDNRFFRKEIAFYKRHNLTTAYTGMPGFTMGFPMLMSFITPTAIRLFNVVRKMETRDIDLLIEHTPLHGMISTYSNKPINWIKTGELFANIALEATHRGIQTSIQAIPENKNELKRILKTSMYPQLFFRAGYAKTRIPVHSPRLPVTQVLS